MKRCWGRGGSTEQLSSRYLVVLHVGLAYSKDEVAFSEFSPIPPPHSKTDFGKATAVAGAHSATDLEAIRKLHRPGNQRVQ